MVVFKAKALRSGGLGEARWAVNRTTSSEKQSGKPTTFLKKTMNLQKNFDPGKFYSAFSYPQEAGFLQGLSDSKGGWTDLLLVFLLPASSQQNGTYPEGRSCGTRPPDSGIL